MYHPREIDEFLSDPDFVASDEYKCLKDWVDCGAYDSVKDVLLSLCNAFENDLMESRNLWPEEIKTAIAAEKSKRFFPPMRRLAECIKDCVTTGNYSVIPEDHWLMLADFIAGNHRGTKGKPVNDFDRNCDAEVFKKYRQLIHEGLSPSRAQEYLAKTEYVEVRTIQRILKRVQEANDSSHLSESLSNYDATRFFRTDRKSDADDT